mgnify:FL=1
MLGFPSGGNVSYYSAMAVFKSSDNHNVTIHPSMNSGGNFNNLWAGALNLGQEQKITHFAQLHSDLIVIDTVNGQPAPKWLDVLLDEMDKYDADLISVPIAIKDERGVTSCGIGDPQDPWCPYRRFTVRELGTWPKLPDTFNAADMGYGDKFLLHNNGMWVADMRKPLWYKDVNGVSTTVHQFNDQIIRVPQNEVGKQWVYRRESEDWTFSRLLHEIGAKTYITKKVMVNHIGAINFSNWGPWGTYPHGDEDTAPKWRGDTK